MSRRKADYGILLDAFPDRPGRSAARMTPPRRLPLGEQLELDEAADNAAMAIPATRTPVQRAFAFKASEDTNSQ